MEIPAIASRPAPLKVASISGGSSLVMYVNHLFVPVTGSGRYQSACMDETEPSGVTTLTFLPAKNSS